MDILYQEFQIETNGSDDWVEMKLNQLVGLTWKLHIEDEEEISMEMMKSVFMNWMKKNHPMKSRKDNNYFQLLDEYIQKKNEWITLSRKVVFDEWIGKRIRRMKRGKETIHYHLTEVERGDIQERLDQIEEIMIEMDRSFMRDYSSKEQMDYFNDLFTRQVSKKKTEIRNPFDAFYVNPTSHISNTFSSFDQNDRYKREEEWDYMNVSQKREAVIERSDEITPANFNEMFEKQKRLENQNKSGLDAFFQVEPMQGSSLAFVSNRPMTKEEMEKTITQHLADSEVEGMIRNVKLG